MALETQPERPARALSYLVVVLTHDSRVQNALPPSLAATDPAVEVHVVDDVKGLRRHLHTLVPDALVLDQKATSEATLPRLLQERLAGDGPVVVLAKDNAVPEAVRENLLHNGASECVPRGLHDIEGLREAIVKTGQLPRLHGYLNAQHQHYQAILEALHDAVFVLDDGVFAYVNGRFAEMIGRDVDSLIGQTRLIDLVKPQEAAILAEHLAALAVGAIEPQTLTFHLVVAEGTLLFEAGCHPSWLAEQRVVVGIGRDITRMRRAQAELEQTRQRAAQVERLRALGELSAGVAHDFNNALGTILGRVALARDKESRNEAVQEDLAVIEMASRHAATTVQRIAEFSRPSNTDTWRDVNLQQVCQQAADFIRTRVPDHVTFQLHTEPTPTIRGNASELCEVLLNLLRNALDATTIGGSVCMTCRRQDENTVIEVVDDGCGMSEEVQNHLFEPFFSTKARQGTGLGLSVSHWILRRHDAQIQVRSAPGQGTCFTLTFEPFKSSSHPATRTRRPIRCIMVVDDDRTVATMLQDLLLEQGYTVHIVGTATAALQTLNKHPIDLVITDLDLPDLGGWQLARRLREVRDDILVGLMTGWPLGAASDELHARGISFVLNKPFSIEALGRNLARLGC